MQLQMTGKTKEFLQIAIPAVLESLVAVVITTIDTKMISVLGKDAISAVSFTTQPKLIFFAIFYALGTTVTIFVAQANGKKDKKEGNYYFHTILKMTIVLSLILGVLLSVLAKPIMMLCNRQAESLDLSVSFFRIIMGFMIFQAVSIVLNAALRGIGKTKVTLVSNIAMGLTDILFNYLLIEGHLGFPRLEIAGDAIATVLGTVAACAISIIAILKNSDFLSFRGMLQERIRSNREAWKAIGSKAGNVIFENLAMRIGFLLSSVIVSMLSSDETAVYAVAMILLNYSFAFGDGIQGAVVALTGRSFGAENYEDFRQYARIAEVCGLICAGGLCVIYLTTAAPYYGMYFSDGASIADGEKSSFIASVLTVVQIFRIIMIGIMRGMGEVKDPRRIATLCVMIVNPVSSYLLTFIAGFRVWGVWGASVITQTLWLVLSIFFCGRHKKRIIEKGALSHVD